MLHKSGPSPKAAPFARLSPEGGTEPDAVILSEWNRLVESVEGLQGQVPRQKGIETVEGRHCGSDL